MTVHSDKIYTIDEWDRKLAGESESIYMYYYMNFDFLSRIMQTYMIPPIEPKETVTILTHLRPSLNDFDLLRMTYGGDFNYYDRIKWAIAISKQEIQSRLIKFNDPGCENLWRFNDGLIDLKSFQFFIIHRN